jgi:hypothetical protein
MVRYDGGMEVLSTESCEKLDDYEEGASEEKRVAAVVDLRVLAAAYALCSDVDYLHLEAGYLDRISVPFGTDGRPSARWTWSQARRAKAFGLAPVTGASPKAGLFYSELPASPKITPHMRG